jgi:hypothetical protein
MLEAMNFMEMQACVTWNEGGPSFKKSLAHRIEGFSELVKAW